MKKIIATILILLFVSIANAQFSEVVYDSTKTQETLYSNALSFFAVAFNSANDVIQMKDASTGKVIGKGLIDKKEVTITISCKNGRYKYEIQYDAVTEMTLPIDQLGNSKLNAGTTKAPVRVVDGKSTIVKDEVYFVYDNKSWSHYKYIYNSESKSHSPAPMTGKYYQDWKIMVDDELNKEKYSKIGQIEDPNIVYLKSKIKQEMSKSDF